MIVSRFTSFTEDFLVCCYEVTEFFRSRHDCTSAFSERSPCYFGPLADVAIFVLREVSFNTVLARARYHSYSRLWRWFTRRTGCCVTMTWNTFIHKILRQFFSPFWQIKQWVFPYVLVVSISILIFRFLVVHATGLPILCFSYSLSLRVGAGRNVRLAASCDNDVGDVCVAELEEPVDKAGTTIGT